MSASRLWRLASVYASGTLLSQLVVLASLPILARLYPPAAFGHYAAVLAVVSFIAMVFTFRLEVALHLPRSEHVAFHLRRAALIGVGSASVIASIAALAVLALSSADTVEHRVSWGILLPILAWSTGKLNVESAWTARHKNQKRVATAQVIRSICTATAQIAIASLTTHQDSVALLIATLIGIFASIGWLHRREQVSVRSSTYPFLRMLGAVRLFSEFPRHSAPQALISSASTNSTSLLLVAFCGPQVGGVYAMAERAVKNPVLLISGSLRQAFTQGFAHSAREGKSPFDDAQKVSKQIALALLLPIAVGILLVPDLVTILLGAQWGEAARVVQWMVPWFYLNTIAAAFLASLQVTRQIKRVLAAEAAVLGAKLLAIPAAALFVGPWAAVFAAAVLPAVGSAAIIWIGLKHKGYSNGNSKLG